MNKDEIIAMARDANPEHDLTAMLPFLSRFAALVAALVAARERSAILRAIDEIEEPPYAGYENPNTFDDGCLAVADAIRARGNHVA